jgi:glycosyltransferase involved in cell wall biosynthesis
MSHHASEGLSLLLPAFNRAGSLERVLWTWSTTLEKLGREYEIVLIDDGSTDASKNLLNGVDGKTGLRGRVPHLRVLDHPERRGHGAALRTGMAIAQFPLVLCAGCDHPCDAAAVKNALKRIDDADPESGRKIDVVNGFRAGWPLTGWRQMIDVLWRSLLRVALGMHVLPRPGRLGSAACLNALLLRFLFGLRIGDVESPFKLFRKGIFARIPIQSDGDFVHAEILAKANFLGCLMDEVPIAEKPIPFSSRGNNAAASRWKELRRVFLHPDFGPAIG